ncbi:MAG: hypothetical protein ACRDWV_10255 [Acidimicrobiales bacterium]
MNHSKLGHRVRIVTTAALVAAGGLGLAACSKAPPRSASPPTASPPTSAASPTSTANSGGGSFTLVPNQAALIAQAVAELKADETANANIWSAAPPSLVRATIANRLFASEESGQALINTMAAYAGAAASHETFVGSNHAVWVTVIPGSFELVGNTPEVYVAACDASAQIILNAQGAPLPGLAGRKADTSGLHLMEYSGTWKNDKTLEGPDYSYSTAVSSCPGWFGQAQQDVVEGKL